VALTARFCTQCGAAVVTRPVEERPRQVCPDCGTVHYQNPLPVAAALVLNPWREVLLVRRRNQPYRGDWCLPMGFAETGETIAAAARRELREEAGIDGQVLRLVDADSSKSEVYGDILIVTFEIDKVAGAERAGDDAEEVRYFPLDRLPELPFASNRRAVASCAAAHREEWAIRDSFGHLAGGDRHGMLSDALVALVEERAGQVARRWLDEVRASPTTASFAALTDDELVAAGVAAVGSFGRWLDAGPGGVDVASDWRRRVVELAGRGCPLAEIVSALTLLKKALWDQATAGGIWDKPIDVYRVLELNRRIALYFDKALFHASSAVAPRAHG
jgi:ADP-ribose pyrophosphatase YjhB (NUDIX family)